MGCAVLLTLCCASAFPVGKTSLFAAQIAPVGKRDFGVIFNTNDILMDLESYQGGLGVKIGLKKSTLRVTTDLLMDTWVPPDTFSLTIGGVLEKHLLPGPLSPYWGPSVRMGFTSLMDRTDADNWTQNIAWEILSAGIVGGIELFIFDFLSVFAEYNLALNVGMNIERVSSAGAISTTSEFAYNLDLGMGNSAKIGIVVYLRRKQ
jgi:hypothetical protein